MFFKNLQKKKFTGRKSGERRGQGIGPLSYPTIRLPPVQKGTNTTLELRW
jgi:hypothetical protein